MLTLMVMDIIVVSSSSVSMYSMYPFATRSCQPPSSGVSWKKYSNGSHIDDEKLVFRTNNRLTGLNSDPHSSNQGDSEVA